MMRSTLVTFILFTATACGDGPAGGAGGSGGQVDAAELVDIRDATALADTLPDDVQDASPLEDAEATDADDASPGEDIQDTTASADTLEDTAAANADDTFVEDTTALEDTLEDTAADAGDTFVEDTAAADADDTFVEDTTALEDTASDTLEDATLPQDDTTVEEVVAPGSPPGIAPLARLFVAQGDSAEVGVVLTDEDPATVTLVAAADDNATLPAEAFAFSGAGAERILTVTAPADALGRVVVTVTATDATGQSGSAAFRTDVLVASTWSGVHQWGAASTNDSSEGVAVDDDGRIYASGWGWGGVDYVGRVDAFDKHGAPLWTVERSAVYDAMARGIAWSRATDRLYLANQEKIVQDSNAQYAVLAQLDPADGAELWREVVDFLDGAPSDYTIGHRVVVDPGGLVHFSGSYRRSTPAGWELGSFLGVFPDSLEAPTDGALWMEDLGPYLQPASVFQRGINGSRPAPDGGVYAVGRTEVPMDGEPLHGAQDAFARRYTADGQALWTRLYGTPANDSAMDVVPSADGRLFLLGATEGLLGDAQLGGRDAFVMAVRAADGEALWVRQLGGPGDDAAQYGALTPEGDLIVVGYENLTSTTATGFVRRLSPKSGAEQWALPLVATSPGYVLPRAVAPIGFDVMVVGRARGSLAGGTWAGALDGWILRVTGDGEIAW